MCHHISWPREVWHGPTSVKSFLRSSRRNLNRIQIWKLPSEGEQRGIHSTSSSHSPLLARLSDTVGCSRNTIQSPDFPPRPSFPALQAKPPGPSPPPPKEALKHHLHYSTPRRKSEYPQVCEMPDPETVKDLRLVSHPQKQNFKTQVGGGSIWSSG